MKHRILALAILLSICLAGCVTTATSSRTDNASMEWRMRSLEESFLDFRENQKEQMRSQQQFQARMENRLNDLEDRLTRVAGGVVPDESAAVSDQGQGQKAQDEGWVTDLEPGEDGKGWTSVTPEGKAQAPEEDEAAQEAQKEEAVAESAEPKPWAEVPGPKMPETAQGLYDLSLDMYRDKKFPAAREGFDAFLSKYPDNKLAGNAMYWKGETYYSEKDFAQAILTFKEVAIKYPQHSKVPAAMLKTGMSYEKTGDRDNAVFYMQTLVQEYPDSSAADVARRRLRALGA